MQWGADADLARKPDVRLYSGRDIADALDYYTAPGEQYVDLRDAYNAGWRGWA